MLTKSINAVKKKPSADQGQPNDKKIVNTVPGAKFELAFCEASDSKKLYSYHFIGSSVLGIEC
jgi:hypothetical protein